MTRKRQKLANGELFAALEPAAPPEGDGSPTDPPAPAADPPVPLPPPSGPPPGPAAAAPAVDTLSLAVREVLSLPPVLLAAMPEATTLALRTLEGVQWYVTTGRETYAALRAAREGAVLTGAELAAIAVAAELDRASALALDQWLALKLSEGTPRIDTHVALGGLQDVGALPAQRWTLERVLRAMGARLERVGVGDGAHLDWLGGQA